MKHEVKKWIESELGRMTFENICRLYSSDKNIKTVAEPPFLRSLQVINKDRKFLIRWNRYEIGTDRIGKTIGCDYFVLKGSCEIKLIGKTIELQADEYFEFPKCKYKFRVAGDEGFEYIAVYKLTD